MDQLRQKEGRGIDLVWDVCKGLPLEDARIDYAVSVHALPELAYPDIGPSLRELRRFLKSGRVLRLVLPDLQKAIRAYLLRRDGYFKGGKEQARSRGGRFILHTLWYGHSAPVYPDFIEEFLLKARFVDVVVCGYRQTASRPRRSSS